MSCTAPQDLPDDVLIYLFELLGVPQILTLRQTCRRLKIVSELHIVWNNACKHQILIPGYPFPTDVDINALSAPDLERHVRRASLLAAQWISEEPLRCGVLSEFDATNGTPVSELRFVPGHAGNWIIAVSKSIWSIIAVWELSDSGDPPIKRFEWSRRDCLLQNFVLNDDDTADAVLAVSVIQESHTHVEIMFIHQELGFCSVGTINSALTPVYFHGDLVVLCDAVDASIIINWRSGASALLQRPQDAAQTAAISLNDRCIQVMFTVAGILVVRARSLTLFPNPPLTADPPAVHPPIAMHSFGWVDGVAVAPILGSTPPDSPPSLSILIRHEPDDPWAADDTHELDLYILYPEPAFPLSTLRPYTFPPVHAARVPSKRGSLQCSALRLGAHATAVWVEPRDRSATGLMDDAYAPVPRKNERLVCAVLPGPLFRGGGASGADLHLDVDETGPISVQGRTLRPNELNNWKTLDYDEARGRVAIGSTRGRITVLDLSLVEPRA
ncbi:hypothetical protein B0H14DRAFT_2702955 [Mycena olivaceomarginata]|nr:hypothetical protein B0H14DRAFT_2702955 [Mycena olivaceomarginata]